MSVAVVDLLRTLVGHATESRTPNLGLIECAAERLESAGGRVTVMDGAPGRANLLASFGPDGPGGLLVSGHTDVVPAGTGWNTDPYSLTADDGDRLYGRGTADMKGFIACLLDVVKLAGRARTEPLHVALSYDEEIGCVGVRGLLDRLGPMGVAPDLVLIGEPTMMRPRNAHLGKVAFDIGVHTAAGHSSRSHTLPNAISVAAAIIGRLDNIQRNHRPPNQADEPTVTVNVGTIRGGTGLNIIAEACSFAFEVRHDAAHDPDVLLRPVWEMVEEQRHKVACVHGRIDADETVRYPALATDRINRHVIGIEALAGEGECTPIGYGTEGGLFAATLGVPVVICGPGDIADAHRPDEYVTVAQLDRCTDFLHRLLAER